MDDLITSAEAAARLGVSRYWIWRLIRDGRLAARKIGQNYLIRAHDLDALQRGSVGRPPRPDGPNARTVKPEDTP